MSELLPVASRPWMAVEPWSMRASVAAKFNLFLNLHGVRPDGFHQLETWMQSVGVWDALTVDWLPRQDGGRPSLGLSCNWPELVEQPETNLVMRAARLFFNLPECQGLLDRWEVRFHLDKAIPHQAGLGGGSADAALTLKMLWEGVGLPLGVKAHTLWELAAQLGSDVPFFLRGGCAQATGRGEQVTPIALSLPPVPVVVIKPIHLNVPTADAYAWVRQMWEQSHGYVKRSSQPLLAGLQQVRTVEGFHDHVVPYMWNDFEAVLYPRLPELLGLKQQLEQMGCIRAMVSGSGPSMIVFPPPEPSSALYERVRALCPPADYEVFWTTLVIPPVHPSLDFGLNLA